MRQRSPVKLVIFLAFLVLAGICALELAICRAMDPDLYETLITPVSHLYHETRLRVKGVSEKYALWLSEQSDERVVLAAQQREQAEERRAERLAEEEARRERENFRLLRQAERERLRLDREVARKLLEEAQLASDPALTGNLSLADPNITELLVRNGQEYLTGGIQPLYYFNQKDEDTVTISRKEYDNLKKYEKLEEIYQYITIIYYLGEFFKTWNKYDF